jgi:hypothetical protein
VQDILESELAIYTVFEQLLGRLAFDYITGKFAIVTMFGSLTELKTLIDALSNDVGFMWLICIN